MASWSLVTICPTSFFFFSFLSWLQLDEIQNVYIFKFKYDELSSFIFVVAKYVESEIDHFGHFSVQFQYTVHTALKYIHIIVQPLPPSISRTLW